MSNRCAAICKFLVSSSVKGCGLLLYPKIRPHPNPPGTLTITEARRQRQQGCSEPPPLRSRRQEESCQGCKARVKEGRTEKGRISNTLSQDQRLVPTKPMTKSSCDQLNLCVQETFFGRKSLRYRLRSDRYQFRGVVSCRAFYLSKVQ